MMTSPPVPLVVETCNSFYVIRSRSLLILYHYKDVKNTSQTCTGWRKRDREKERKNCIKIIPCNKVIYIFHEGDETIFIGNKHCSDHYWNSKSYSYSFSRAQGQKCGQIFLTVKPIKRGSATTPDVSPSVVSVTQKPLNQNNVNESQRIRHRV